MKVGSLFAGIGGFEIAAESKGWETRWFCEIDSFCCATLTHHWPDATLYGNVKQVDYDQVEPIDVLCAGFPCQPHSVAGKKLSNEDDRDLWPEVVRAVRALRPDYAVLENVPGLLSSEFTVGNVEGRRTVIPAGFFGRVLGDLAALGYDARWDVLSAAECGAPQKRDRIWIVAYPAGLARQDADGSDVRRGISEARGSGRDVGDADGGRRELAHRRQNVRDWRDARPVAGVDGTVRLIPEQAAREGPESALWPVAHGVPGRVARLRGVGNAVCPKWVVDGPFAEIDRLEAERVA